MNQRDTKPLTVQAKTVDAALKEAASKFETTVDQLDYELVSKTDAGFLSFSVWKKVEIKAWPKSRPQIRNVGVLTVPRITVKNRVVAAMSVKTRTQLRKWALSP